MATDTPDDIMEMANSRVHAAHALRGDLLDVLFPRSGAPPSEMLQVQVKLILQQLVLGIEQSLIGDKRRQAESWEMLSMSALLREPSLVEFALARLAEGQLRERLGQAGPSTLLSQLPTILLGSDQTRFADLARTLLDAEQPGNAANLLYKRLAPETLHLLCWRIVAALRPEGADDGLLSSAKLLLGAHDGDSDPFAVAEKLMFFLGPDYRSELVDPKRAGLSLFVAALARNTALPCDTVVRLIDDSSHTPLLLLLKAAAFPVAGISDIFLCLRGEVPAEVGRDYAALDAVEARAMVAAWRSDVPE